MMMRLVRLLKLLMIRLLLKLQQLYFGSECWIEAKVNCFR